MSAMSVVSHPPRGLKVEDLHNTNSKLVSSNPNSPFVKDGYTSQDMHDTEVNEHIEDLMSFANDIANTPGQTSGGESGEEEFQVSDGQGGFVVNLGHTFDGTDDHRPSYDGRNSSTSDKQIPSPRLAKLTALKAKRDRERRRQEEEEEENSGSFWSWCCAGSRETEESTTGTAPSEHN